MANIECFFSLHSAFAYLGSSHLAEIFTLNNATVIYKPIDYGPPV